MMVSVLHKELEYTMYKLEKHKYKKVGGHVAKEQNQIQTSSWYVNHTRSVYTNIFSHDWLMKSTIY